MLGISLLSAAQESLWYVFFLKGPLNLRPYVFTGEAPPSTLSQYLTEKFKLQNWLALKNMQNTVDKIILSNSCGNQPCYVKSVLLEIN